MTITNILRLAITLTLVPLFGCDGRDIENELNTALAERNGALAERNDLAVELDTERTKRQEIQAWADELQSRGNPISSISLSVSVDCEYLPSTSPNTVSAAGTIITLTGPNLSWRLIDELGQLPDGNCSDSGHHEVTIQYRPEQDEAIIGQDVQTLAQITTMGVRYGRIFPSMGIAVGQRGVTRITVDVNGINVLDARNLGLPTSREGEDFEILDVSRYFATIPESYFSALRQRARDRAAR